MEITLGQQCNVGEKPTVILYTYICRDARKKAKINQKQCMINSTSSNRVEIIIYCFICCKDKTSTWHLNGFPDGSNLGSTV